MASSKQTNFDEKIRTDTRALVCWQLASTPPEKTRTQRRHKRSPLVCGNFREFFDVGPWRSTWTNFKNADSPWLPCPVPSSAAFLVLLCSRSNRVDAINSVAMTFICLNVFKCEATSQAHAPRTMKPSDRIVSSCSCRKSLLRFVPRLDSSPWLPRLVHYVCAPCSLKTDPNRLAMVDAKCSSFPPKDGELARQVWLV